RQPATAATRAARREVWRWGVSTVILLRSRRKRFLTVLCQRKPPAARGQRPGTYRKLSLTAAVGRPAVRHRTSSQTAVPGPSSRENRWAAVAVAGTPRPRGEGARRGVEKRRGVGTHGWDVVTVGMG